MQREQDGRGDGDSARERQVPAFLTSKARESKRRRDNCRLLNPGDPPLRAAKLAEQAKRKDHTEDRAPAHVEDLVAGLVNVTGKPVDEVDEPEVDRQRSEGDNKSHPPQPGRATYARHDGQLARTTGQLRTG